MTKEQPLERLERENRRMRWIGAVAVALLVGCTSYDYRLSIGASWKPGVDEIPAIADQLATYDALVVGEFYTPLQDATTQSAARTFRSLLVAELEKLGVYPTVAGAAAPNVKAVLMRGTFHHCRKSPAGKAPKCELRAIIQVCDARTGEVLCQRRVTSAATGASGLEHSEALRGAATDIAHWINALKEGRRPFVGETRWPQYAAIQ